MRSKHGNGRTDEGTKQQPRVRRGGVAKRARGDVVRAHGLAGVQGTLAHLARFGLAITGDPLLEVKPEGG